MDASGGASPSNPSHVGTGFAGAAHTNNQSNKRPGEQSSGLFVDPAIGYDAAMATSLFYPTPLVTAKQFLEMEFGSDVKAELDNGVIRMMAGGTAAHARVQGNVFAFLRQRLRGSGCRVYNSDMAVNTHEFAIRYPDVAVYCREGVRPEDDGLKAFNSPAVIFEVLSAGTARTDLRVKLEEYKALPSVETIVFVDVVKERVRVLQRRETDLWSDLSATHPHDVELPSLGITIPHTEIFARD